MIDRSEPAQRTLSAALEGAFNAAEVEGFLYASEIGDDFGSRDVAFNADMPVALASVFKIFVAVAYGRAVVAGDLDPAESVVITKDYRRGGIGTDGCAYDVTLSWRDVAEFMITLSDNAATDILYDRLGKSAIDKVISDLGLRRTRVDGCCRDLFELADDEVRSRFGDRLANGRIDDLWDSLSVSEILSLKLRDPEGVQSSTPREIAQLLEAIWTDRAGPPEACAIVRGILSRQVWPHRIGSGFEGKVVTAGKTGTIDGVRNEAAVVTFPDGRAFVVAIFTRSQNVESRNARNDRAIGEAARIAVTHLQ